MLYEDITGEESPFTDKDWEAARFFVGQRIYWPEREHYASYKERAYRTLIDAPQTHWYLEDRGVMGIARTARLGYDSGWYVIPVISPDGDVKGFVARAGPRVERLTGMRFDMPYDQRAMLYSPRYPWTQPNLFVVFGMFDALVLAALGLDVCTTTCGDLSFDPHWVGHLEDKRIWFVPDAGGGEVATKLKEQVGFISRVLHLRYDEQVKDPADYAKYGRIAELADVLGDVLGGLF